MCSVSVPSRRRGSLAPTLSAGALLVLLTSACGARYVARGSGLYEEGRYVEAAEVFEQTEQRLSTSSRDERARFGLYRGATFLKLGDAERAARWLGYSRALVQSDASALGKRDLGLLEASLKALATAKRPLSEPTSDSEVATAPANHDAAPTQ
jgi:hypothetical protein